MKDSADLQGTDMDYVRSLSRETLENTTLLSLRYLRTAHAFEERATVTVKEAMDELDGHVPVELREHADRFMAVVGAAQIERGQLLAELVVALGPAIEKAMGIEPGTARFEFGSVFDPDFPFNQGDVGDLPPRLRDALATIAVKLLRTLPANLQLFLVRYRPMAQTILDKARSEGFVNRAEVADVLDIATAFANAGVADPLNRARAEFAFARKGALS